MVAIFSARDQYHSTCVEWLSSLKPPLLTCWPVITEAAWLLRRTPSAIRDVLAMVDAGLFSLLPLDASAPSSIRLFLARYETLGAQLADAALMYLAEREGIDAIFTLDQRDFTVYRTTRGRRMKIVPELP